MKKVSLSREIESDSRSLCGSNYLVITHGSARLNHGADPAVKENLKSVSKREKSIGRRHRTLSALPRATHCQMTRVHPIDLAHSNTDARGALGQQYGV